MSFRKNILASYSSQIFSVGCSFLASILATRMLGNRGQGSLALYTNFVLIFTLLISAGLPSGIVHYIASGKIQKQKLLSLLFSIISIGLILTFGVICLLTFFSSITTFLPSFITLKTSWILLLFIHLFFMTVNSFFAAILQAEHKFRNAGFIVMLGSLSFLLLYACRYYSNYFNQIEPLKWVIVSLVLGNGFQFILYLYQIYKTNPEYFHWAKIELPVIKPILQFAFLAFSTNLIQFLSYRMDIWFVHYFHNTERTGIYALSAALAQMVWMLPAAIQSVLYSFISTHQDKQLNIDKTIRTTKQIGLYAISAGIIGYLLSIWLVPILFGVEFNDSVQCIGILLLGIVPFCLSMSVSAYFAATGRVRINLYSAIIGFVICLIGDILLIPSYGIIGASFASVLSYIATVSFLLLKFRSELKTI